LGNLSIASKISIFVLCFFAFLSCLEYQVEIVHPGAGLKSVPKFYSKDIYHPPKGSVWKVLTYKHGWVKVYGPTGMDSEDDAAGSAKIQSTEKKIKLPQKKYSGWLRERDFKRVPVLGMKDVLSLKKKRNDVPIRWATVPLIIILLASLLYLNNFFTRLFISPIIVVLFFFLSVQLASQHKRANYLGSKVFKTVGKYLYEHRGPRIYTTDDIWRRRLNFYMKYWPMRGNQNTILAITEERQENSDGGYYLVVDPRLYHRITWNPPAFVKTGEFPENWKTIMKFGEVKLFFIPQKIN
jgi:hypothetical protein